MDTHSSVGDWSILTDAVSLAIAAKHKAKQSKVVIGGEMEDICDRLASFDFECPTSELDLTSNLLELLGDHAVRNDHPRYFGLFNPPSLPPSVIGDLITAIINPQLAVWSHAPAASEIERKVLEFFGKSIGWCDATVAGTFTTGGSEANQTALMTALAKRYPQWRSKGLQALKKRPAIYVSSESHLAWVKLARMAGLGSDSVRLVAPANGLALTGCELVDAIRSDVDFDPALIVATAGATGHGAVDDMASIGQVAREHKAHYHVDAAWAGGVLLSEKHGSILAAIDTADSVTIDAHKWLCVPMGAGMYLGRSWNELATAFDVSTEYMPSASRELRDPYIHSVQWSRRFIGLKVFMALASLGRSGYSTMIDHMIAMGEYLRQQLKKRHWIIHNDTQLPLICFSPPISDDGKIRSIADRIVKSGKTWLSTVPVRGTLTLRACITSYETRQEDIDCLIELLCKENTRHAI